MVTETCFPVRFTEIDSLGIVHHSNYPKWLEAGRNDYLKKANMPSYRLKARGFYLPLLEMNFKFKSPAKYGDEILVITRLVYVSYVRLKFEYKVLSKLTRNVLATGRTVHVWTNKKIEPVNMQKGAPEVYRKLRRLVEATENS